jgi:hypothetical protein
MGAALPGEEALAGAGEAGDAVEPYGVGGAGREVLAGEGLDEELDPPPLGLLGQPPEVPRRGDDARHG